jgi:PAS domain S-box-containing protein
MGLSPAAVQQRRFTAALVAAVVLCGLFLALLVSPLPLSTRQSVSGAGIALGGALIVVSGVLAALRCSGSARRPWVLLSCAAAIAALGNIWAAAPVGDPSGSPSLVTDGCLVIALALSIAGLLGLAPARQRGAELTLMVLDGLVVGCAALVIASIVVYSRILDSATGSFLERATSLVLPLLDVVLATVAILLIVRSRGNRLFFSLVGVGFVMYAVADLVYAVEAAQGGFIYGGPRDLVWIAGYLLLAAAAWHPSVGGRAHDVVGSHSDIQGTVLVFGVLLAAFAVQVVHAGDASLSETQTILWVLLVLAAGARQTMLTADNAALRHGLEQRVRDQTADLRRMARQTEILLSSVGDGIYGVDPDGRITFVNPSGALVLGHDAESLLGKRAHEEFHAPQEDGTPYDWTACYITESIRHGVVATAETDSYVRADGTSFPVEITSSPLLDDERIRGAVVVFRDVTQRHEVDRMKNEFLSVVSHELRTPLTSIRGSLGILGSGALVELTPQAARLVSIAVESSDRLTRLINDILDIERMESGKFPMALVAHGSEDLLHACATELDGLATSSGIRVQVEPSSGLVLADADRIIQTLTNLVGNAIKFSRPGGVVRIRAEEGPEHVVFAVHDDGTGIPEDSLQAVFEPFVQVDSSDARQQGGTGLGLAISRGIVERHGGRIWAESTLATGTTVRFSLPRVRTGLDTASEAGALPVEDAESVC